MATRITKEIADLLADSETFKILATLDEHGAPRAAVAPDLAVDEEGNIIYLEGEESSRTNEDLLRSIWFAKEVSITLIGRGDQTYQITGRVVRVHVSGPVFQQHYVARREKLGDVDLAAVWIIAPQEVLDDSWQARRRKEEAHPNFVHLDRLVKARAEALL